MVALQHEHGGGRGDHDTPVSGVQSTPRRRRPRKRIRDARKRLPGWYVEAFRRFDGDVRSPEENVRNPDVWMDVGLLKNHIRGFRGRDNVDGKPVLSFIGERTWVADVSNGCAQPYVRREFGRLGFTTPAPKTRAMSLEYHHPCRKKSCEKCMGRRKSQWIARALNESEQSVRTWMASFTMSPAQHALLDMAAYKLWTGKGRAPTGEEFTTLRFRVFAERFYEDWLVPVVGRKPLTDVRFLLVGELHDSERTSPTMRHRPHMHALILERRLGAFVSDVQCERVFDDGRPVYRTKADSWPNVMWQRFGFLDMRLAMAFDHAAYVLKYLDFGTDRVRSSRHFGNSVSPLDAEAAEIYSRAIPVFVSSKQNGTNLERATSELSVTEAAQLP